MASLCRTILRPFHHLLPEFRAGFTILTSDLEAYSVKAHELMERYELQGFAFEEFERIQRAPEVDHLKQGHCH